jgi:hypothetical protein
VTTEEIDRLLYLGSKNALNILLTLWTDDIDRNRENAEKLLAQAILKAEGL